MSDKRKKFVKTIGLAVSETERENLQTAAGGKRKFSKWARKILDANSRNNKK